MPELIILSILVGILLFLIVSVVIFSVTAGIIIGVTELKLYLKDKING